MPRDRVKPTTLRPEAQARDRFVRDTAEHTMAVLRDDGLYRHLRFQRPDSSFYYFDLVTWPGHLVICGDAGDYHFSRARDMFAFFGPQGARAGFDDVEYGINAWYWGEKLQGARAGRDGAMSYSHDAFRAQLYQWAEQEAEDGWNYEMYPGLLREALDREVLYDWTHSAAEARERLDEVMRDVDDHDLFSDAWEWDLRELDHRFLWCCWAIVWGIEQYRAATREAATQEAVTA